MVVKPAFIGILCLGVLARRGPLLNAQQPPPTSRGRLTIAFLKNTDDFNTAGCMLWRIKDRRYVPGKSIFVSDYERHAAMNINGRDVKLTLVDSQELQPGFKVGDHSSSWYRGDGFDVR